MSKKEQTKIFAKADELRHEVHDASRLVSAGLFVVAGAIALSGLANLHRT